MSTWRWIRNGTIVLSAGAVLWTVAHNRSAAVRGWQPTSLPRMRVGGLSCRLGGSGSSGALLLHGLIATGDVFGRAADELVTSRSVAVRDLLGFGRSLDEARSNFGTTAHLKAIDAVVAETSGDGRLLVAAHSMAGCEGFDGHFAHEVSAESRPMCAPWQNPGGGACSRVTRTLIRGS